MMITRPPNDAPIPMPILAGTLMPVLAGGRMVVVGRGMRYELVDAVEALLVVF